MASRPSLLDLIARRPIIFDGAMGTMIYGRGVFVHACYDELCLSKPERITSIHQEYVRAGVDILETNTFVADCLQGVQVSAPLGKIDAALAVLAE